MPSTYGRIVQANQVILDQVDFFQPDGFTRVVGLLPGNLSPKVFHNNLIQPWPIISGVGIPNAQVSSGFLYFDEIAGQPGYYNVRFRPNSLGFWRILIEYTAGQQIAAQNFDVVLTSPVSESGLQASFIKPGNGNCC